MPPSARTVFRPALSLLVILTLLTGLAYPMLVTGLAQVLFPAQANGSLVHAQGRVVGSALIGQPFDDARYFWGRPSATAPVPDNAAASSASNLGPSNPALWEAVRARVAGLRAADPSQVAAPVPVDLVTSSASGLDPDISPAAALYQIHRVARARQVPEATVRALVEAHMQGRVLGVFGERRANVLELNLALDALRPGGARR